MQGAYLGASSEGTTVIRIISRGNDVDGGAGRDVREHRASVVGVQPAIEKTVIIGFGVHLPWVEWFRRFRF
jgi:hypothetical protein